MVPGRLPLQRSFARWAVLALGMVFVAAYALTAQTQRMLQETLPADAPPIQLNADEVSSWKSGGEQIFLLRGNVVVSQGTATIRSSDMVVWVDMQRYQADNVFSAVVYGDKAMRLENGTSVDADFGYVRLTTYGTFNIKSFKNTTTQDQSSDPIFQRALAQRPKDWKPTVVSQPSAPKVDENLIQVAAWQPPPAPVTPAPPPIVLPNQELRTAPLDPMTTTNFQPPVDPKGGPMPGDAPPPPAPLFTPPPAGAIPATKPAPAPTKPRLNVRPLTQGELYVKYKPVEGGMTALIVSGGVNLFVTMPSKTPGKTVDFLDIEADRLVIWTKGNAQQLFTNISSPQGEEGGANEVYMSGHVALRSRTEKAIETLYANEVYYDFGRNVAIARQADFEMILPKVPTPIHFVAKELWQTSIGVREAKQATIFSSTIPSDPGLKAEVSNATVEDRQKDRTYLYGLWTPTDKEGKRIVDTDHIFTGTNTFLYLEGVPVMYFPYLKGRVEDPLGPFEQINMGYDTIFGFQIRTTWDLYDIFDLPHFDGTRWRLYLDYLTQRGPGFGTEFDLAGKDYFGIKGNYLANLKLYGIADKGVDDLGYNRGAVAFWPDQFTSWPVEQPYFRGIATGKINVQEMDDGFSVRGQFGFISDRNFLEQYYLDSQVNDLNYDTYLQVKQQKGNWAWTLGGQISTRDWVTETNWLPKADGYLIGQTFSFEQFEDLLVYNGHAQAGYAQLLPTQQVPFAYLPTDVRTNTARLDLMQDISLPFYAGPVKVVPYVVADVAYYSEDVNGAAVGRLYGAGGVRWSMPFSRLYPDIQSDLLNLDQIYHKMVFTGNYFLAQSNTGFNNLPQLTRFNDDASDQALRDIRPLQAAINPNYANFLTASNLFNPQNYALRRLVDTSPDTLDTIEVIQFGLQQRLQTQRGFPGNEHTVDWMTLNLQASIFPQANRDNFGHTFGIVNYDWTWNIGDRTALAASGWFEPFNGGPRAFDIGAVLGRPDSSQFYLGYSQIDPLNSKAVIASVTYPFSAKYALTASTVWDFGDQVTMYSLFLTRLGTDVMVSFGISYNSTVNVFGVAFEVMPNLGRQTGRNAALFPMAPNMNLDPILNQK